jgi:hypothetical protein
VDWARAIERNSEALKGILAALFAMLEQAGGATARLPRPLHRAVLSVLRPAESAVRRLIVIAARGLTVKPAPARPVPQGLTGRGRRDRLAFRLFDPRKRFLPERRGAGPACHPAHPRHRPRSACHGSVVIARAGSRSRFAAR